MNGKPINKLKAALIALAIAIATALTAWLAGCSLKADRDSISVDVLYPQARLKVDVDARPTTQPVLDAPR